MDCHQRHCRIGSGIPVAQGGKNLGRRQTAFDAEIAAIEAVFQWHSSNNLFRNMVIHSDSTSATARVQHSGAGPGQSVARSVVHILAHLFVMEGRSEEIQWIKGHAGVPGNEKAGTLADEAAEKKGRSRIASLA